MIPFTNTSVVWTQVRVDKMPPPTVQPVSSVGSTRQQAAPAPPASSTVSSESLVQSDSLVQPDDRRPADAAVCAHLAQSALLLSRGRPHAALRAADSALAATPTTGRQRARALLARGVALSAAVSPAAAVPDLDASLRADSESMAAAAALGSALAASDPLRVPQALSLLRAATRANIPSADTSLAALLTDIGVRLARASLPAAAFEHYEQAVEVAPSYAQAWYNLGVCAADTGDSERAAKCYMRCVQVNPLHTQAWTNIGVLRKAAGNTKEAVEAYERALSIDPNYDLAKRNLAIALCELATASKSRNSTKDTMKIYKKAIALQPTFADAHYCLGVVYCEAGKNDRALTCYQLAIQFNPRLVEAHHNLGVVHKLMGNFDAAVAAYKAALCVDANHHQTHSNIAVVYTLLGDVEKAAEHLRAAMLLSPNYAESHNNAGVLERDQGDIERAILHYERCIALDPSSGMAAQNRLHALNYTDAWSPQRVYQEHIKWGIEFEARIEQHMLQALAAAEPASIVNPDLAAYMSATKRPRTPDAVPRGRTAQRCPADHKIGKGEADGSRDSRQAVCANGDMGSTSPHVKHATNGMHNGHTKTTGRALRVGYVSPDFFTHSVSYFAEVLFANHSPEKVQVFAYANVARVDSKTAKLRSYPAVKETWRNIWGMSAVAVANLIIRDEIDILVDCTGHTAANRLDVFALAPAPVQVTWIGYPNTTGLATIHYRVTDGLVDPVDTTQRFSEQLWRLPDCFLCYTPSDDAPPVAKAPPCLTSGGIVTFGSFNVLAKTQDRTIRLWASILKDVPNSRLILKSKALGSPSGRRRIEGLFQACGVSPDRLDLVALLPSTAAHLRHYGQVDIALDPFPYAGTTTTCEALYMGVPVVTLGVPAEKGDHANNVGVSLLTTIGHEELIAFTEQDYLRIAVQLAGSPTRLTELRQTLRRDMTTSPLGDAKRYIENVEAMLFGMWQARGGTVAEEVRACGPIPEHFKTSTSDDSLGSHATADSNCKKKHRVSKHHVQDASHISLGGNEEADKNGVEGKKDIASTGARSVQSHEMSSNASNWNQIRAPDR